MIDIRPDPKHPRGGFAKITIPNGALETESVTVAVFNSYQQKWLGPEGWQPNRAEIPARSAEVSGDAIVLVVGPDIVNKIEEDTPIRLEIGGGSWDTYWPDDINAGPDEAVVGELGGTGSSPEVKGPTVVTAAAEPDNSLEVLSGEDEQEPLEETTLEDEEKTEKSKLPVFILGGLVFAAVLGALGYFLLRPEAESAPVTIAEEVTEPEPVLTPDPEPIEIADPCSISALSDLRSESFSAVADQMRTCAGSLSADSALGLVETAANADDPAALSLFGAIYDSSVTDEAIETGIGLTFSDQPSRAAEYYARAIDAGSSEAVDRLKAVCTRLFLKTDTLSQSSYEDYCK